MGILINQTAARLILQTDIDFTNKDIDTVRINYRKPNQEKGFWQAAILEDGETEGKIYVDFTSDKKFDIPGKWKINAEVIFHGGSSAPGEIIEYEVQYEL